MNYYYRLIGGKKPHTPALLWNDGNSPTPIPALEKWSIGVMETAVYPCPSLEGWNADETEFLG